MCSVRTRLYPYFCVSLPRLHLLSRAHECAYYSKLFASKGQDHSRSRSQSPVAIVVRTDADPSRSHSYHGRNEPHVLHKPHRSNSSRSHSSLPRVQAIKVGDPGHRPHRSHHHGHHGADVIVTRPLSSSPPPFTMRFSSSLAASTAFALSFFSLSLLPTKATPTSDMRRTGPVRTRLLLPLPPPRRLLQHMRQSQLQPLLFFLSRRSP